MANEISVAADADEASIVQSAQADSKVAVHLDGHIIRKSIYVPGKIVNFVVN
jgi:leucyl-tRNA synthetase